jgi:hypothetical protein
MQLTAGHEGTRPRRRPEADDVAVASGLRRLAARSDPSANGSMPDATAAAAPPDDPPAVIRRSYGLRVAPNTLLNVWLPAPNSGVLVLPIKDRACRTPVDRRARDSRSARGRRRSASRASCAQPFVASRSCTRWAARQEGRRSPLVRSTRFAAASAASGTNVTIALTLSSTRSICAMNARIASVAEIFRAAIIRARRRAGVKTSSVSAGIEIRESRIASVPSEARSGSDS